MSESGPNHRTNDTLKILPIIPIKLNSNWNLVTRTILPIIKQPTVSTTDDNAWGCALHSFRPSSFRLIQAL